MPKNAAYGATSTEKAEKIGLKEYISTFKIPGVWIMSILVWCYVTISAVASYLTPYSTNVLGMSAVLASSIGTIRTYGCRLVGGPRGGFIADKAFKSVSKEQVLGQTACAVTLGLFLVLPTGISGGLLVVLLLLVGVAMFLCKGTYFSVQPELGIPTNVSATAVAIATLIGYLPDMFVHTMFGKWIDTYGNAGYTRIFIYGIGTAVLGIIAALQLHGVGLLAFHGIPLVHHNNAGFALLVGVASHLAVLLGKADGGIHKDQRHAAALHSSQCAHHHVALQTI